MVWAVAGRPLRDARARTPRRVVDAFIWADVGFFGDSVTAGNRRLCDAGGVQAEEFCKQGPCRFGRSAAVEDGITGVEPGSAKEGRAGIPQHSCWPKDAPALDDVPRGVVAAASGRSRLLCGGPDQGVHRAHRTRRSRGGCRSAWSRTRRAADPGQPRACLTRPISFRYHFAAEALLALI